VGEIDIVLPVCARDCERLQTLGASLRRFWHVPGVLRIFTEDGDHDVVLEAARKYLVGDLWVEVMKTSDMLERPPSKDTRKGWWRQQLAKLCAARIVESDFYLTIDADCFLTQPIEYEDLVKRGRGVVTTREVDRYRPEWYHASREILGLGPQHMPGRFVDMPPFLLARTPVQYLLARLKDKHGPSWKGALLTYADHWPWTEYTLYHLHTTYSGVWDAFHVESPSLTGNSIWTPADIEGWDPRKCFAEGAAPFAVVQSHTTLPPEWVWERVAPFLAAPEGEVRAGAGGGSAE
jgi:hypothetical protein